MGSRPLSSLRARLFLLVLLTALPVTFLWGFSALQIRQRALLDAESFVLQVARGAVREYEALVQGARQLLPALAANRQVLELDGQGCSREFARLLSVYPQYATLGAIAADGQVFCSSIPFTPPIDASDRLYFREAIASGGFAIGEFQIGRVTGVPSVNFGYPATDDSGQVVAVVLAALDLAWVNDLAVASELPAGGTMTVFDHNGTILARYPDPEAWVGKANPEAEVVEVALASTGETSAGARGLDGVDKVYGILPLAGEGAASRVPHGRDPGRSGLRSRDGRRKGSAARAIGSDCSCRNRRLVRRRANGRPPGGCHHPGDTRNRPGTPRGPDRSSRRRG